MELGLCFCITMNINGDIPLRIRFRFTFVVLVMFYGRFLAQIVYNVDNELTQSCTISVSPRKCSAVIELMLFLDRVRKKSNQSKRKSASLVFSKRPLYAFEQTSDEKKKKKRLVQQKLQFTSSCSKSRPRGGAAS